MVNLRTSLDDWRDDLRHRSATLWREASVSARARAADLARRTALARQPRPDGVSGPPLKLFLGEFAAFARRHKDTPPVHLAACPQPVMLLPGFGARPNSMRKLGGALEAAGHEVHEWGLGANFGPSAENLAYLIGRVSRLARQAGRPITLVGWSLGGLFAREIARRVPGAVGGVITLGTPFSGDRRANNAWRAYQFVAGHPVDEPPVYCDFAAKPPMPTIALWSPRDGVISPRSAAGWPGERDVAVALRCSHLGFCSDPDALGEVLRQLDLIG